MKRENKIESTVNDLDTYEICCLVLLLDFVSSGCHNTKELHSIDVLSRLDIYMMALLYQYNGCLMIYASGGVIHKHYRTLHIKEKE